MQPGVVGMRNGRFIVVLEALARNEKDQRSGILCPRFVGFYQQIEEGLPLIGVAASIQGVPLLCIKRGRSPTSSFKQRHEFIAGNFFTRHCPWRPTVDKYRFDGKVRLTEIASSGHARTKMNYSMSSLTS